MKDNWLSNLNVVAFMSFCTTVKMNAIGFHVRERVNGLIKIIVIQNGNKYASFSLIYMMSINDDKRVLRQACMSMQ